MVNQRVVNVTSPLWSTDKSVEDQIKEKNEDDIGTVIGLLSSEYIKSHGVWRHWYLADFPNRESYNVQLLNNNDYVPLNEGRAMTMPAYTEEDVNIGIMVSKVRHYEGSKELKEKYLK